MKKVLTLMLVFALSLTIAGCAQDPEGPTDAENLADAKQKLSLDVADQLSVTANVVLPTTGLNESTIVWASDNEVVIATDGTVTRPAVGEDDVVVVLTATITVGEESDTKVFNLKVIANVPVLDVTIAEFNSNTVAAGDDVVVTGVIFGFVPGKGVQISDGTGYVYVYNNGSVADTLALGDLVKVTGKKTIYFGLPEVTDIASIEYVSSGNTLPTYEVTSIVDLFDEDAYDTIYFSKPITITGMVKMDDTDVVIVATDNNMAYNIVVYYASDAAKLTALEALAGKVVTVDVIVYGYHDGLGAWRVTVASNAVVSSVDPTDAQLAAYEAGQLDLGDLTEVKDNLVLPTAGIVAGTTIAWASDDAAVTDAGVVTRVVGSDTTVTLTATITVGSEVATKAFTAIVKDADYAVATMTVTEALLEDDDTEVVIKGVVTGFDYSDRPYIQGADGAAIYVRAKGLVVETGDEIIVRGVLTTFSDTNGDLNLRQLDWDSTLVEIVSHDNVIVTDATKTPTYIAENYLDHYSEVFTMTLKYLEIKDVDTKGHDHYMFEGYVDASDPVVPENDIPLAISVDYFPWFEEIFSVNDTLEVTFLISDYNYDTIRLVPVMNPVLTDAQMKIIVEDMLSVDESVTSDLTLPTEYPEYNTTITWSSNNFAIGNNGDVTRPDSDESNAVVTLTATVTVGSLPAYDIVFTVTVLAEDPPFVAVVDSELFISEYIEGGYSNKAVEIFNPTASAITMTGYTIELYSSSDDRYTASQTLDLSSYTIQPGEVFVISNSSAIAAIDDESDVTSSITYYNGDDAVALLKDGVVIDVVGVIGVDPGSSWTVGTGSTSNYTLVRARPVTGPNATFDTSEWLVYPQDDVNYIGYHIMVPAA